MSELAPFMVSKKLTETAKVYICLAHLGGTATTREIKHCGVENGLRAATQWNPASTFRSGGERVAQLGDKWKLLPKGYDYVKSHGFDLGPSKDSRGGKEKGPSEQAHIVIGHGRSPIWRELKEWLRDHYECKVHEFNSQSVVGVSHTERLQELIDVADMAFLIMTAEDETGDGSTRARQNVVHEVGLFQGALGFRNAAILLEEGCDEFSNIAGLGQIRFPAGDVKPAFEQLRQYLRDQHNLT